MFRVGQKVVCVDGTPHAAWSDCATPKKGAVYTIRATMISRRGTLHVHLNEITNKARMSNDGFGEPYYIHSRFRPLIERKTDISIFTEILRKHSKKKPAPAFSTQQAWHG